VEPLRLFYADPPIATREVSIHALGIHEWMEPGLVNRPAGTGDYLIMHFHQPVLLGVAGGTREVPAHTLMAWGPRDGHLYGWERARWNHSWMHCHGRAVGRALEAAGVPLATPIPIEARALEDCVRAIHGEIRRNARADEAIVCDHLDILARELGRAVAGGGTAVPARWLELRRHLEECFDQPLRLRELARRAGCSVPHLCAEFKRWFGCSAIEFAIRQRMHRALLLLRNRNLAIGEIASAVGYQDLHHFSKLFTKRHGAPPSAVRRKLVER
jgi:AraC-like DNA-binding protein